MLRVQLSESFMINEGLNDVHERIAAEKPISDEELTDLWQEAGLKTDEVEADGRVLIVIENGSSIEATAANSREASSLPYHEDCEVCSGGRAYDVAGLDSIIFLAPFDRDRNGSPPLEAAFIRDDNSDWMFVAGEVVPHATKLARVAARLSDQS